MAVTVSMVAIFGLVLFFLLRSRSLGYGSAFVAVGFGLFLASTGAAEPINQLTTAVLEETLACLEEARTDPLYAAFVVAADVRRSPALATVAPGTATRDRRERLARIRSRVHDADGPAYRAQEPQQTLRADHG